MAAADEGASLSSIAWRSTSNTGVLNLGSSFRNITQRLASEISRKA